MLKRFFVSMLGSLAAFWVSIMLIVVLGMFFAVGAVVSSISSSPKVSLEKHSILHLKLSSSITERATPPDFYSIMNREPMPEALDAIVKALAAAKEDSKIEGLFIECDGASAGIATREAIRESILDFKKSGKWAIAYGNDISQGDYYIASSADEIFLNPVGGVEIRGLATVIPYFRKFLDKVGIQMQVVKVGTFKSAVEPFLLDSMSSANRMQTHVYLDNMGNCISQSIAGSRGISVSKVNAIADSLLTMADAKELETLKLIDGLKYSDEIENYLKSKVGISGNDDLNLLTIGEYLSADVKIPNTKSNKNKIAVYYANGDITVSGRDGIASDRVVPDILDLADEDDIEAMVLRVNSGGGSAFASEQIWHALEVFKSKGKKLYVSMGDYAASGGYYISCGADKIYAQPLTLTGSIGIFGMLPCVKELVNDKLGISFSDVATNKNSAGYTIFNPLTPFQREKLQQEVNRGYELFTSRCAEGRHMPQDSIKAIAEGRVWDGNTAKEIGLVDALGSLSETIADLAAEMGYEKYQVVEYPGSKNNFWEIIAQFDTDMETRIVRSQLGNLYPAFKYFNGLSDADKLQARMDFMIID